MKRQLLFLYPKNSERQEKIIEIVYIITKIMKLINIIVENNVNS